MREGVRERAVIVDNLRCAASVLDGVDRWYFGSEFCMRLLPSCAGMVRRLKFARRIRKSVTFLTPVVTESGLEALRRLFCLLDGEDGAEVVFNDWGVFYLLRQKFPLIVPVMGRLLTRQRRDPRMASLLQGNSLCQGARTARAIPSALKAYYRHFSFHPQHLDFLAAQGIKRVELDCPFWDITVDVGTSIAVSLHQPYGYIATGRMCRLVSGSMSGRGCRQACRSRYVECVDSLLPGPMYAVGGTLFYKKEGGFAGKLKSCDQARTRVVSCQGMPH